ncbi:site-specific integrase [Nesterenkonia populi]
MATQTRDKGEGSVFPYRNIWAATLELPPGPDGKRRPKWFYSKKKSTVVKKLNDAKQHLAEHGDLPTSSITLEKWVAKWLTEIAPKNLNPNTLRSYRSSLTHHVVPRLGKRRLDRLQPGAIREALQEIAEEKSTGTAKNAYSYLRACLRDAVTDGVISRHPMEHLKPPKVVRKDANALDVEQAVYLLQWLTRRMDDPQRADGLEPLWITYLLTGERRNEALGPERGARH